MEATIVLGNAYEAVGRIRESVSLLESACDKLQNKLGDQHDLSIVAMDGLASVYQRTGHLHKAVELHEQVLKSSRDLHGVDDIRTLSYQHHLAESYSIARRNRDAIRHLSQVLETRKMKLGRTHPETLATLSKLAALHDQVSPKSADLVVLEDAVDLVKARLGVDHPSTLLMERNLAWAYHEQDSAERAIQLLEETTQKAESKLGHQHPDTCTWLNELASFYMQAGQTEKALARQAPLLKLRVSHARREGDTRRLSTQLVLFGRNLHARGHYRESEAALREAVEVSKKTNSNTWEHFYAVSWLGRPLLSQGKFADAEPLMISGYEGLMQNIGSIPEYTDVDFRVLILAIVELYREWGKESESAEWAETLEKHRRASIEAKRLRVQASESADRGALRDALQNYERARSLPWQLAIHRPARLYARSLDWERANSAFANAFPVDASWQELCLLFRLDRPDEYRALRRIVLKDYTNPGRKWQYFDNLRMSLLLPLDPDTEVPVRYLGAINENRLGVGESASLVGKIKYRLGEFSAWYRSLPADSAFRQGQDLLVAMSMARDEFSTTNRRTLEREIARHREIAIEALYSNIHESRWQDYIEQMAWVREAEQIVADNAPTKVQRWPDEGLDLIALSDEILALEGQAQVAIKSGDLAAAIQCYERIVEHPGQVLAVSKLIDLHARTQNWNEALALCEKIPGDYRNVLLLYQLGKMDECRDCLQDLLTSEALKSDEFHSFLHARAAIMLPMDDSVRSVVVGLKNANADPAVKESWRHILVGPLAYRLGEFREWRNELPEQSRLRKGIELLSAITDFQEDGGAANRSTLESEVVKLESRMEWLKEKDDLGPNWVDHLWRNALALEARQILTAQ